MLIHSTHWQFAHKRHLFGERCFCCFANNNEENEQAHETSKGNTPQEDGTIEAISKEAAKHIDYIYPLNIANMLQRPYALRAALDILESNPKLTQGNNEKLHNLLQARAALENPDISTSTKEWRDLAGEIQTIILNNPEFAKRIAQFTYERTKLYEEIQEQIGNLHLRDLLLADKVLSKKIKPEERHCLAYVDTLTDEDIEKLWPGNSIDSYMTITGNEQPTLSLEIDETHMNQEERAALAGIRNSIAVSAKQYDAEGIPTKRQKIQLIKEKILAARRIAVMEKQDYGTESTTENLSVILQKRREENIEANRLLEHTLQLQAATLYDTWKQLKKNVEKDEEIQQILQEHPAVLTEILHTEMRVFAAMQTAHRTSQLTKEQESTKKEHHLPSPEDPQFLASANVLQKSIEDLQWVQNTSIKDIVEKAMSKTKQRKEHAEAWLTARKSRIDQAAKLLTYDATYYESLIGGEENEFFTGKNGLIEVIQKLANPKDEEGISKEEILCALTPQRMQYLEYILQIVENPFLQEHLQKGIAFTQAYSVASPDTEQQHIQRETAHLQKQFFTSEIGTTPHLEALKLPIAQVLGIPELLKTSLTDIEQKRLLANELYQSAEQEEKESKKNEIQEQARNLLANCRLQLERLKNAMPMLLAIMTPTSVQETNKEAEPSSYNRATGAITINTTALQKHAQNIAQNSTENVHTIYERLYKEELEHERGHALVHILKNKTGALPQLFAAASLAINHTDAREDLRSRANAWKINDEGRDLLEEFTIEEEQRILSTKKQHESLDQEEKDIARIRAKNRFDELLLDELLNKYASMKSKNKTPSNYSDPTDRKLLQILDGDTPQATSAPHSDLLLEAGSHPDVTLKSTEYDEEEEDSQSNEDLDIDVTSNIGNDILEIQNDMLLIEEFIKNHAHTKGIAEFQDWKEQWKQFLEEKIKKPYYTDEASKKEPENILRKKIDYMQNEYISNAKKQIKDIESVEYENAGEAKGGGLLLTLKSIEFVSINDIINMVKSAGEDIQRMWKRRGERVQSVLGSAITDWIPDNNIWGLSYAGQLKHEFNRRASASELEEVKQWKDALSDLDSPTLQEYLAGTSNKDRIRAIVEILIERGRLDLNDEKFWHALVRISGINMPITACRNNSILRDRWLQQMVTEIWGDKDKYFEWRQQNDSGFDSGKKKFTPMADQLSNVSGGFAGTLERQLKLWVEARDKGVTPPEDVNPHLYEEILHYSMRNGKMSMNDKMFFLVQAIRHRLLSIERLQALAGETGGVLNVFPLIDYFTAGNNTLAEIDAIGRRLEEDSDNRFKPGPKTSLWIQMEVVRNVNAKSRLIKATSGTRAENIDHEDIPTVMAQADYKTVKRMVDIVSGSREKMSPEAVKNAYTGFGTKFKIMARLAETGYLTKTDIDDTIQSIIAYMYYDNIVTKNASKLKDGLASLSWNDMESHSPSSGVVPIKAYRSANNGFISEVFQRLQPQILDKMHRMGNTLIRDPNNTDTVNEDSPQASNVSDIDQIAKALTEILTNNPSVISELLKKYADEFEEEGGKNTLTTDEIRSYYAKRSQHGSAT